MNAPISSRLLGFVLIGACGGAAAPPAAPPASDEFAHCTCEQLSGAPADPTDIERERWQRVRHAGDELVGELAVIFREHGCDGAEVEAKVTATLDAHDGAYRELHAVRIATCFAVDRWTGYTASPEAKPGSVVVVSSTLRSGCDGVADHTQQRIHDWMATRGCSVFR